MFAFWFTFCFLLFWFIVAPITVAIIGYIADEKQFQYGRNPFRRVCKKCGAHQNVMEYYGNRKQWEEVYPLGNNENCECHSYASKPLY